MLRMMAPGMIIKDYTVLSLMSYWSRKGEVSLDYWYKNNLGYEFERFPVIRGQRNLTAYVEAIMCLSVKEDAFCWSDYRNRMTDATMLEDFGYELRGKFPLDAISWCPNIESKFIETSFTAGRNGFVVEYQTRMYMPTEYDRIFDQHFIQFPGGLSNAHYFMNEATPLCNDVLNFNFEGCKNDLNYDFDKSQVYIRNLDRPDATRDECNDQYFMEVEFALHVTVDKYGRLMRMYVYGPDHRALWWQHVAQEVCGLTEIRQVCF